eukprot:552864_1
MTTIHTKDCECKRNDSCIKCKRTRCGNCSMCKIYPELEYECKECLSSPQYYQYLFSLIKLIYDSIFQENIMEMNIIKLITNYSFAMQCIVKNCDTIIPMQIANYSIHCNHMHLIKNNPHIICKQCCKSQESNLIVNYLPLKLSEGTLATLFSPYGVLERVKIVIDLKTRKSKGYGFIKYDNPISAQQAQVALNGYELHGKTFKVAMARPQCKETANTNLYVKYVPSYYRENHLAKLFAPFGKIIECRILFYP